MSHAIQARNTPRARGFTKLELLVVVALLSALLALLLPAYFRAREGGRLSQCISNIRQIHMALKMYEGDYGHLPVHVGSNGGEHWINQISPYTHNSTIFICPSDPQRGHGVSSFFGPPCSYFYCYTHLFLGPGGAYRNPTVNSPLLFCNSHPDYQMVLGRNDGSVELPPPHRYARVGLEVE